MGAFASDWIADRCADAATRVPHTFLADSRIHTSKEAYKRLRIEYSDVRDGYILQVFPRQIGEMIIAESVSAGQAVFGRPPTQDITHLSSDNPIGVRFTRNIPASEVSPPAVGIPSMTMEFMREEVAKSKLQRLT